MKIFIAHATPAIQVWMAGPWAFLTSRRFLWRFFKLPLSGDANQWINPITSWWSGNQISVNLGESGSPETEAEILRRVGTYGRQLGQITDAVVVLLQHLPKDTSLSAEESEAIKAFEEMANDIAKIKESHKLKALRPRKSGAASS